MTASGSPNVRRLGLVWPWSSDDRQKLDAAAAEIVALKAVVTRLQKSVEQLEAARRRLATRRFVEPRQCGPVILRRCERRADSPSAVAGRQ
jgi:hypothetical protein